LLSSFLALGLLPLFEAAGFVTDYRLVELGSLNHPVLRQLLLRAPGTYHHSVLVGALAEAGCEAIGANALEAKIAAYFHDIGKAKHPEYFVENQRGINRHDRMDPWESARVIIEHVTEGARVASEQGLPKPILDNIYMHHGTGLLAYFHRRASERSRTPVPEDAFRYPGPKPRSREAGVLMLADKVEAATRTLEAPTPENLAAMIDRIISSVLADGQLSDCDLTFRQLSTVATAFVGVLEGIYHQRITYDETRDLSEARPQRAAVGDGRRPELVALRGGPAEVDAARDEDTDYEAVRHLPGNESP
jgi:putative nucleotidyltransferase with HDIG domain